MVLVQPFLLAILFIINCLGLQSQLFVPHGDEKLVGFDVLAFLLLIDNT